jgi:hypothetical protein
VKRPRSVILLTALPFLAVYEASSLRLHTCVDPDGTGLRAAVIAAKPERQKPVSDHFAKMDPGASWVVRENGVFGETFRLAQDARFTDPRRFDGLTITRDTRFGAWPLAATVYTYTDRIQRCDFTPGAKEQQGAAATDFEYSVTMPGTIDAGSVQPAGGRVEGNTVTWKLKLDSDSQQVNVTSEDPVWIFHSLVLYLLIVLAALILRFTLARSRSKPRTI